MTEPNNGPRSLVWPPLRWLLLGELAIFCMIAWLAVEMNFTEATSVAGNADPAWRAISALAFSVSMVAIMHALGMHVLRSRRSLLQLLLKYVCCAVAAAILLWLLYGVAVPAGETADPQALPAAAVAPAANGGLWSSLALGFALLLLWRLLLSLLIDSAAMRRHVLVVGSGRAATVLRDALRRRSDRRGLEIVGYLPLRGEESGSVEPARLLHTRANLGRLCRQHAVSEIVIAQDSAGVELPLRELLACRFQGVGVTQAASFVERECGRIPLELADPHWWLYRNGFADGGTKRVMKRGFDLVAGSLILLFALPLMLLCALAIMLDDGWRASILYRQTRTGRGGRCFRLFKFRSMREDAESDGVARWARNNDDRVTRVGKVLRKTRLDELPQLFNVIRGDMSLVGPRPERPEFVRDLARQIPYYEQRHAVRPGMTGWAQLCYPYGASTRDAVEKLKYDLYYIKNHTLAFDLTILLRTVEVVLFGKGAR